MMNLIGQMTLRIILSTLSKNNPPVQIYVNKTKHRIAFKIKTSCKIELLSSETKKLLGSTKKMLIKIKTVEMYQN